MIGPFVRQGTRPILTSDDVPVPAMGVLNLGVAECDGAVLLLARVVDRQGISRLHVARSRNGVDGWAFDAHPLLEPDVPGYPFEEWGCEDPRVTFHAPPRRGAPMCRGRARDSRQRWRILSETIRRVARMHRMIDKG